VKKTPQIATQIIPLRKPAPDRLEIFMGLRTTRLDCDMWSCPGGKGDLGESAEDAGVRELAEETGLIIQKKELLTLGVGDISYPSGEAFKLSIMVVNAADRVLKNNSPQEHERMQWFDLEDRLERSRLKQNMPHRLEWLLSKILHHRTKRIEEIAASVRQEIAVFQGVYYKKNHPQDPEVT